MGLVIAPVVVFWIVSFFFSWRMGYYLLMDKPFFPYILTIIFVALLSALTYVLFGLFTFKGRSEIWVFEIPWFFLLNKYAIVSFLLSLMAYLFGSDFFNSDISKAAIFIIAFSVTLGSLIGCFSSSVFMQKYNISVMY
ncbi:hypothetical protein [Vibrio cincinnatiensis]|uniref:hypothetical protein n=1 Tax=Vibrio cincinnatiensis TaxID=675 RepID=UPI001EDEDFA9|nr:hypothetical protein [Vibrio cincinnatiensis]MCG3727736.1 hypothetical protein [Vibrio cincinnatiensis]